VDTSCSARLGRSLKRVPSLYRPARAARTWAGARMPPRHVEGIPGRVHRNDFMLTGGSRLAADVYAAAGREAVAAIDRALRSDGATLETARSVLDFGCGYGRVLRWLVQRVPPAHVGAHDIDAPAMRFCAAEFGVEAVAAPAEGRLAPYELVWAGSVATHLPEAAWLAWIHGLRAVLDEGATVVFTTHGPRLVGNEGYMPGMAARAAEMRAGLETGGFAYLPYRHGRGDDYGVAFHDRGRVEADLAAVGLRPTMYEERGWAGHQDIHAYKKDPASGL
jgi:SAM-dependent methyltransferase